MKLPICFLNHQLKVRRRKPEPLSEMLVRQAQLGASYRVPCQSVLVGSPNRAKLNQQLVPSVARLAEPDTWRTTVVKRTQGTLQAAGETCLP